MKPMLQKVQRSVIRTHTPYVFPTCRYGGRYIIYTCKAGILRKHQIEMLRMYFVKKLKRFNVRIFMRSELNKPYTKKAKQARMGKGKGKFAHWYSRLDRGTPVCEIFIQRVRVDVRTRSVLRTLQLTDVQFLVKRIQKRFTLPLKCYLKKNDLCLNTSFRCR